MRRILGMSVAAILAAAIALPAGATQAGARTLVGRAPAWYTPALRAAVAEAGPRGVPIPASASVPTSSLSFLGIRPGQLILVDAKDGTTSLCTSNFVFRSSSSWFIGTAGHCGGVGDSVTMVFLPLGLVHIGDIVRSVNPPEDKDGNFDPSATDFALISIDPALDEYISPSMAYWGGPTGVFTGDGVQPILHAGWGVGIGAGGTPRSGVAYAWNDGSEYRFEGAVTPGDSGSGAIVAGGLAAGNITHIVADTSQAPAVWNGGTTMGAILDYLGPGYALATCDLPVPWPLPGCPGA